MKAAAPVKRMIVHKSRLLLFLATVAASQAQTFTTLVNFNSVNGAYPQHVALIQGTDGNIWGTTGGGGAGSLGTIFKMTPAGVLTTMHSFSGTDGATPFRRTDPGHQ
jgi:uncharacterized repeat protein (TIGR03803 family)